MTPTEAATPVKALEESSTYEQDYTLLNDDDKYVEVMDPEKELFRLPCQLRLSFHTFLVFTVVSTILNSLPYLYIVFEPLLQMPDSLDDSQILLILPLLLVFLLFPAGYFLAAAIEVDIEGELRIQSSTMSFQFVERKLDQTTQSKLSNTEDCSVKQEKRSPCILVDDATV